MKILMFGLLIVLVAATDNDPEIDMDTPHIIARWGYPVETHRVTTSDGYIIDLHRIPHGKNDAPSKNRPVVFMQHGFLCSSSNWITNLPNQSAGFIFADAGFDVWLGNLRGNTYGRAHTTLTDKMEKFWEFSYDEHAAIDLPELINFVLETTGQASLEYIGHSQGTMTMFAHVSEDQTFAQKINNFFALAPVASMNHVEGLLGFLARTFDMPLEILYQLFGSGEFLPSDNLMKVISKELCGTNPENDLCDNILFLIAGPESNQLNETRTSVYLAHTPAGVSTQNVIHFMQTIHNSAGGNSKFDYESKAKNEQKYGQDTPPAYDFAKLNVKTHLYWGDADYLADPTDVRALLPTLPAQFVKTRTELKDFNHMDFIWGLRASSEVYQPIIATIKAGWTRE